MTIDYDKHGASLTCRLEEIVLLRDVMMRIHGSLLSVLNKTLISSWLLFHIIYFSALFVVPKMLW